LLREVGLGLLELSRQLLNDQSLIGSSRTTTLRKGRENHSQLQSTALILIGNALALIGQQLLFFLLAMTFRIIGSRLSLRRDVIKKAPSLRSWNLLLLLVDEKICYFLLC
jgi:hypothetical protein